MPSTFNNEIHARDHDYERMLVVVFHFVNDLFLHIFKDYQSTSNSIMHTRVTMSRCFSFRETTCFYVYSKTFHEAEIFIAARV